MKSPIKLAIPIILVLVAIVAVVIVMCTDNQQPQLQLTQTVFSSSVQTSLPTSIATLPSTTQTVVTNPISSTPTTTEPPTTVPLATKPVETTPPATAPAPTQPPVTEPPVTAPPITEPPATEPPATEAPAPQAPVYDCGVEGHICKNEAYHCALMEYIEEGCTHCGSSECPCLLSIDIDGCTWPDYAKCPQYNEHKDPTVYCQDCGLIRAGHAKSGQECCRRANKDVACPWCQNAITAGECHRCTRP